MGSIQIKRYDLSLRRFPGLSTHWEARQFAICIFHFAICNSPEGRRSRASWDAPRTFVKQASLMKPVEWRSDSKSQDTSPDGSRVQIATFGRGVWEVNFNREDGQ